MGLLSCLSIRYGSYGGKLVTGEVGSGVRNRIHSGILWICVNSVIKSNNRESARKESLLCRPKGCLYNRKWVRCEGLNGLVIQAELYPDNKRGWLEGRSVKGEGCRHLEG